MNPRTGAALIVLGVFILALLNVEWESVPGLVKAYAVLASGIICLAAFFAVRGEPSELSKVLVDVTFQATSGFAAAVIIATVLASLGAFPFDELLTGMGWSESATKPVDLGSQVLLGERASLFIDITNADLYLLPGENSRISFSGRLTVYSNSEKNARELMNITRVKLLRPRQGAYRIEVERPQGGPLPNRGYRLNLTVRVPEDVKVSLDFDAVNGHLTLGKILLGGANVSITNGDLTLDGPVGERLSARLVNGRIRGSLTVQTAELSAWNGRIDISIGRGKGKYLLTNRNGNVNVRLPEDEIGLLLDASTVNGRVEAGSLELDYERDSRTAKRGRSPSYDAKGIRIEVKASTINGNVEILGGKA